MDDIIIFSHTAEDHEGDLPAVFQRLIKANLSVKLSKCQFFLPQVAFLGFLATQDGIKATPEKI
jgi:beta-lactamase superfamily II metal-dependent hydrolase